MERTPPCDPDAETALLGAMLLEPAVIPLVAGAVKPEDFYEPRHATVFEAILLVDTAGKHVDVRTVADQLRAMPIGIKNDDRTVARLNTIGGAQYLGELTSSAFTLAATLEHARIVAEHAARRRVIDAASRALHHAYGLAPLVKLAALGGAVADAATGALTARAADFTHDLQDFSDAVAEGAADRVTTTGFLDLDRLLAGGYRGGELIIDAARPAVGKTAKALRGARLAAERGPVVFVSLEMPRAQLTQRVVSAESGVALHRLRARTLDANDHRAINGALKRLRALSLKILDLKTLAAGRGARPTLTTLRAALLREKARAGGRLDQVVVDYLQLVRADRNRDVREQEVSEVARGLKELALELDAPVLALAQLNRAIERRGEDAEPELSDLRESGEIEQAADIVAFLSRPKAQPGVLKVHVKKQRNGPTDTVDLQWAPDCARPGDLAHGYDDTKVVALHTRPGVQRAVEAWPEVPPENTQESGT